ncbi:DUF2971 domain-containing protein [Stenotrophomonas maltophilia]|uniref:DUF2971 domain-containing protein n=1 Tax=Stenotrophomonas TaxID=40323 RepID=UPI0013116894|nr:MULTISPECIES: DUF2971 domain-containing protein [Stenotrophomonas maltophilia group]MBA0224083.1 DUF2971 domain-containing protein [Stenotrophomonas maltophilia]MBA0364893.1 DUF2971 domain-containing protein [Stenotrophomonas maltophilia]MBA0402434.1 DUF2971 domain-containing protein [Stenotrophomonas maltophilia]MCF3521037.1 DUF2971 domain-containing protein [Stenotrophomonas maltophilia]
MRNATDEKIDEFEHLWRYFKTDRFVELLQTEEVYFAAARQFQDRFEGATAVLPQNAYIDPRFPTEGDHAERAFEQLRRLTKISCWHRSSYESDAMWQLYAGSWKGVAIRTTPGRLAAAANTFRLEPHHEGEDLWGGNVTYVDLLKQRLRINELTRFWYKHMAFSWEREFRLGISLRPAEEFGVAVPEEGIRVRFNLDVLVDRIFLGPSLEQRDVQQIRHAVEKAGLGDRIRVSSMLGTPRYT